MILLQRTFLMFCPTVTITNRNTLRHIQDLHWTSLEIICSDKHLSNYHRNDVRKFKSIAEVIALDINRIY